MSDAAKNIELVHGALADGSSWLKVIPLLEGKGHRAVAVQNPVTALARQLARTKRIVALQNPPFFRQETTGEAVLRTPQQAIPRNTTGPRYLSAGGKTTLRPFASFEALRGFKTTAAAETFTRIAKKEKYNGRLQQTQ